ncbi:ATP-dependent DNA ligase [Nocardiopsis gilva YIM 90087]|uniref:ATP-dependent DNA ligase n=1 Tax=Nocardiopsis gilva YIM 90087 TaxID=1235441 RepID=A0A223S629_9ACTN|nr:RNA ligase family protein [Nocardiopsis gilva]ASU83597.1 ATP-dependent DNA ligase [Nocardiopsis gilva YIM 90087]
MVPERMLAKTVTAMPVGDHLVYEPKWDGFRTRVTTGPTRIVSKSGYITNQRWPELVAALDTLPDGLLLDGEIVCWRDGRLSFDALLRRNTASPRRARGLARTQPAHFVAFDLLREDGEEIWHQPLRDRRQRLEALFAADHDPHLDLAWQTADPDEARDWYEHLTDVGIEGLIIKDSREPYRPGKRAWYKYKNLQTTEAIVGAVVGSVEAPTALVLGRHDPETGELRIVGRTSPLSPPQQRDLAPLLEEASSGHPWPGGNAPALGPSRAAPYTRVTPDVVVEVAPDTGVAAGRWRHSVRYVRVRPDLSVDEVPQGLDIERRSG